MRKKTLFGEEENISLLKGGGELFPPPPGGGGNNYIGSTGMSSRPTALFFKEPPGAGSPHLSPRMRAIVQLLSPCGDSQTEVRTEKVK